MNCDKVIPVENQEEKKLATGLGSWGAARSEVGAGLLSSMREKLRGSMDPRGESPELRGEECARSGYCCCRVNFILSSSSGYQVAVLSRTL